jgi:hypothetical protein
MFSFFKERPNHLDRLQALMELSAEFPRMQKDAPASAWFFARNLVNARPLIDLHAPVKTKLDHINSELGSQDNDAIPNDEQAGISFTLCKRKAAPLTATTKRRHKIGACLSDFSDSDKEVGCRGGENRA